MSKTMVDVADCSRRNSKVGITNADKIRSMSDEELAQKFNGGCPPIRLNDEVCMVHKTCTQCWLDWLKLPYKEITT